MTAEKLYRIKPLDFIELNSGAFEAENPVGRFIFRPREKQTKVHCDWEWSASFLRWHGVDSREEAKLAAESRYRERLLQCLKEVNVATLVADDILKHGVGYVYVKENKE